MGNYKDNRMEELSNKGNGNYAYIDSIREAKKVLVDQMAGTLYTIAKDVKLQIEFNPAYVKAYRLIGYENRMLNTEDFIDDTKDAGELGAGHTVTAIYEIIPRGSDEKIADVDDLKYQRTTISGKGFSELATVKLRYKKPDKDVSTPLDVSVHSNPLTPDKCSDNFNWSAAVAGFGMLLSDGAELGDLNWKIVQNLAR
jgi:Ca-activated chloride channel family protein